MFLQYEIGCILVRDADAHRAAFTLTPEYLKGTEDGRGLAGGDLPWYTDLGFQLSRKFASLKVWMEIKHHGVAKFGRLIRQNMEQARYLADLIDKAPELELSAPVASNVVCFQYTRPGLDLGFANELNKKIVVELQEQGIAVPSGTTLDDQYVIRVGITNHRSRRDDFDILVHEVRRIGDDLYAIDLGDE
jgi:glutamate/tyrosine decarboxylase-like PLP-dependent enzyme